MRRRVKGFEVFRVLGFGSGLGRGIFALMELGFGFRALGFWGLEALESRVLGFQALGIARLGLEDCRFSVGF